MVEFKTNNGRLTTEFYIWCGEISFLFLLKTMTILSRNNAIVVCIKKYYKVQL
jgi:hypothetical protein